MLSQVGFAQVPEKWITFILAVDRKAHLQSASTRERQTTGPAGIEVPARLRRKVRTSFSPSSSLRRERQLQHMSLTSLLHLPLEIQDAIASHIPKAYDILNFGLTCKSIFTMVASRHLEYRYIEPIDMSRNQDCEVWRDLIAHPDRTANINSLDLKFTTFRKRFSPEAITAINLMQNLHEVTLMDNFDTNSAPTREAQAVVWEILSRIASLKFLRIILAPGCNILFASEISKVTSLTSLEISVIGDERSGETQGKINSLLLEWVQKNTCLESLSLSLMRYTLGIRMLSVISLPQLRSLNLEARLANGTDPQCVEAFFRNHSNLVELHYDLSGPDYGAYPLGRVTLPYLEKLSGSAEGVSCVLRHNIDLQNNMRCVKNYSFDATADRLDVDKMRMLSYKFRYLEWLRVGGEETVWDEDVKYYRQLSPAEWAMVTVHLPYLKVFRGVPFLGDPHRNDDVDDRAAALCRLSPRLRFIDHWDEPELAIRLTRKADDVVVWDVVSSKFANNSVNWRNSR